ncbi:hypothetical protein [Aquimarina algiphila]|nr:hypothetical protein [Aquimarina algiphila]
MGRFTNKSASENAETLRFLNGLDEPIEQKRTANSDLHTNDGSDIDLDSLLTGQL